LSLTVRRGLPDPADFFSSILPQDSADQIVADLLIHGMRCCSLELEMPHRHSNSIIHYGLPDDIDPDIQCEQPGETDDDAPSPSPLRYRSATLQRGSRCCRGAFISSQAVG
jgi:hypothetical protein